MRAKKDPKTGKWYIRYRYTDWQGKRRESMRRGFDTKHDAEEWLRSFLAEQSTDLDILFKDFAGIYFNGISPRLRENTLRTKHYIVDLKILPYFGTKKISEITPANIIAWENELLTKGYAQTYMKTVYNQLNAIFNYAVKYYDLRTNPCAKAGAIGKNKAEEMSFWTREEFTKFVECIADKPMAYTAYNTMFWTGLRIGELLALTPADIDFTAKTLTVNKSYQRLGKRDVITPPKTPKSNRTISIPDFLCEQLEQYKNSLYDIKDDDRLFPVTKHFLHHEMQRGCKKSGVKRIRLHDIRHSHCALLYELGICLLLVHHTRKQKSGDTFDMISGTNGLFGAADGAFLLYKQKRTDNKAALEISGRDQQDQKINLIRNEEKLSWDFESAETELWKKPPDPLLEKIASYITDENPEWTGTATELVEKLGEDIKPNALTMKLNVMASRLFDEYGVKYDNTRTHNGRCVILKRNQ